MTKITTSTQHCEDRSSGTANRERNKMTKLTKDQAIEIVGTDSVSLVEKENCEPTNRVGVNGACQGDDLCEWSAFIHCKDINGEECTLIAYYYTTNEQDQIIADASDGSAIDWVIDHYSVI